MSAKIELQCRMTREQLFNSLPIHHVRLKEGSGTKPELIITVFLRKINEDVKSHQKDDFKSSAIPRRSVWIPLKLAPDNCKDNWPAQNTLT